MYIRCLMAVLATLAIAQWSVAESSDVGAGGSQQYRLSGVLISDTRKSALVNGRLVQEGSEIGGAVVEAIDRRQIQIRVGSTRQVIRVGGSFTAGPSASTHRATMVVSRESKKPERIDGLASVEPQPQAEIHDDVATMTLGRSSADKTVDERMQNESREHIVASGETLSGIALRYRTAGMSMDQMMMALFDDNPFAFDGNINALKAGATLKIPAGTAIAPDVAMAKVASQNKRWRDGSHTDENQFAALEAMATDSASTTSGPVQSGDTLSEIALDLHQAHNDVSTNQLMVALYESNPHAFGHSIDVLYEGAVLTLPDRTVIAALSDNDARAEVLRHWSANRRAEESKVGPGFDVETIVSAEDVPTENVRRW